MASALRNECCDNLGTSNINVDFPITPSQLVENSFEGAMGHLKSCLKPQ